MEPIVGLRTKLYPHFRTGDFTFDLRPMMPRLERYTRSLARAVKEARLPLARALLISVGHAAWWDLCRAAKQHAWNPAWFDHEGVHDGIALRAFEEQLRSQLASGESVLISLPESGRGRAAFRTMKCMADVGHSVALNHNARAWWLY